MSNNPTTTPRQQHIITAILSFFGLATAGAEFLLIAMMGRLEGRQWGVDDFMLLGVMNVVAAVAIFGIASSLHRAEVAEEALKQRMVERLEQEERLKRLRGGGE